MADHTIAEHTVAAWSSDSQHGGAIHSMVESAATIHTC